METMSINRQDLALDTSDKRYAYTAGDDEDLLHLRLIDRGGFGEVHKVLHNRNSINFLDVENLKR